MTAVFAIAAVVALVSTGLVVTRTNAVHALLYLLVSFLAVAVVFFTLGAPFVAALEVLIYAGAVIVLFLFAVMLLAIGRNETRDATLLPPPRSWIGPSLLALVLLGEILVVVLGAPPSGPPAGTVGPRAVARALFGPYLIAVEIAGMLLLGGLVGAYHLARHDRPSEEEG